MPIGKYRSLHEVPPELNQIHAVNIGAQRPKPIFRFPVLSDIFNIGVDITAPYKRFDMTWLFARNTGDADQKVPAWTGFNQTLTDISPDVSVTGYMPIIPAPAHDMDTIHTVLVRCQAITKKLGQADVITFDEALYCKAKELVWHKPDQFANVIVRLGGFHIAQNFLRAIGQHCTDCGLSDAWVETGVYDECTADRILEGKCWNRAIRAHKLTMEALWRLMYSELKKWKNSMGEDVNPSLMEKSVEVAESFANHDLATIRSSVSDCFSLVENSMGDFHDFILSRSQDGTFVFWKQYIDMISHLLCFIRAERDGHWDLHLESFKEMLSLMAIYDHVNYARWGTVYALDMEKIATYCSNGACRVFRWELRDQKV